MKIYLAARYGRREELCGYRAELEAMGHVVTSRWLNGDHQVSDDGLSLPGTPRQARQFADDDLVDLCDSDAIVSFSEPPRSVPNRGGRHVEFGIGIGLTVALQTLDDVTGLPRTAPHLVVVGHRENVFHCLDCV